MTVRIAYAMAGVFVAVVWLSHRGDSPWVHGIRLLAIMAVVMTTTALLRRWAAAKGRRVPHHPIGRFLVAKVALVGIGVAAAVLLQETIPQIDIWIAVGMGLLTAGLGPLLHPWLAKTTTATAPAAA